MSTEPEQLNTTEPTEPATTGTTEPTTESAADTALIGGKEASEPTTEATPHAFDAPVEFETFAETVPEGIELDETQSAEFLDIINGAESKADLATKMLAMYAQVASETATAATDAWTEMQSTWQDEMRADPELGGEALAENLGRANALVKKYGGDTFAEALNLTGLGNNLAMLQFLTAVAADLPQDATPVSGKPAGGDTRLADRLFGGATQ